MNDAFERVRRGTPHLSVGIGTADQLHLHDAVATVATAGVQIIHLDVMDGVFCPLRMTATPALARALADRFVVDVHLMVSEPLAQVDTWIEAGAEIVTFHLEATRHPHRILQAMGGRDVICGVALTPGTPVALVEPLLDDMDLLLLVAVNPGWPGQRFLPGTVRRLREAAVLVGGHDVLVAVDGSITRDGLAGELAAAGADIVVAGSAVFDGEARANAALMLEQVRGHR